MAATMERLDEYRTYNAQFTQRLTTFLAMKFQAAMLETDVMADKDKRNTTGPTLPSHENMEAFIRRYSGLVLYTREMDETKYAKICGVSADTAVTDLLLMFGVSYRIIFLLQARCTPRK
jgi:hypothetical protein